MKTCIGCNHVTINPSHVYSEYTQESFSIECDRHHFYYSESDSENEFFRCMMTAEGCPDFELVPDLAKLEGSK